MPRADFPFYLVTDRHQTLGRDLIWVLSEALEGGVRAVQLREKDLGGRDLYNLAERARKLTDTYKAILIINDRIDVVLAVGADGVQLGHASLPIDAARKLLGPGKLIGASTHSVDESEKAAAAGADFIVFGPVYNTPSKAAYGPPQGLTALRSVVEKLSLPVYAIGGIKPENVHETMRTGCRGVAVISAVIAAADPRLAARDILTLISNRART